jgi:hypothetical protein
MNILIVDDNKDITFAVGGALHGMYKGADIASSRTLKGIAGSDPQTQQTSQQTHGPTQQVQSTQQDIVIDDSDVDKLIKKLIENCDGTDILLLITTMLDVIDSRLK